jgi:hypothetical protein
MSPGHGADWAITPLPGLTSRYLNNAIVENHITENINNNKE